MNAKHRKSLWQLFEALTMAILIGSIISFALGFYLGLDVVLYSCMALFGVGLGLGLVIDRKEMKELNKAGLDSDELISLTEQVCTNTP